MSISLTSLMYIRHIRDQSIVWHSDTQKTSGGQQVEHDVHI